MNPKRLSQFIIPAGVVCIIIMMVVPLPSQILDFLIAVNIAFSLLVVLVAMYIKRPLDFSVFPSLLLVATLFRLSLNVSATRLVLIDGFAGKVIDTFGHFVVGGQIVVGLVVFAILLVIQFVVITNGAGRVAEVGARFTLDAMPGKQMAIDADLNAGFINEAQARQRRADVTAEADFYGAMDGASKFVKGDAIAAIIIVLINLIGGIVIGMVQHGMDIMTAINTYSLLSVGDGLVSQIPALLLSVSTGLMVTRASNSSDMGSTVVRQLGVQKRALQIAGLAAIALCLVPGLPKLPFLLVGGALLFVGQRAPQPSTGEQNDVPAPTPPEPALDPESPQAILGQSQVDALEIQLAPDLVDLVDGPGADLLDRIRGLRHKIAQDLGLVMPPVRTRDNLELPLATYAIRISGVEIARGRAPQGQVLAIGDGLDALPGQAGREPVFGLPGKWIAAGLRSQAEMLGATVVDRSAVMITHLAEVVRGHAPQLLGREDVATMVETLKRSHPVVVEDLTPALLTLGEIQSVLRGLLAERVPIRDLTRIFESLSVAAKASTAPDHLLEAARAGLGPAIVESHVEDGVLPAFTLDPVLEQHLLETLRQGDGGRQIGVEPATAEGLVTDLRQRSETAAQSGRHPVLVCAAPLRLPLHRLVSLSLPDLAVLAYSEVNGTPRGVETLGVISGADHAAV